MKQFLGVTGILLTLLMLGLGASMFLLRQTVEPNTAPPTASATALTKLGQSQSPVARPNRTEYATIVPTTSDVQSAENIPFYQGARDVVTQTEFPSRSGRVVDYKVDGSTEDVLGFYLAVLPKRGYATKPVGTRTPTPDFSEFTWSDAWDQAPYRLVLSIVISTPQPASVDLESAPQVSDHLTSVNISLRRLPYASKVPMYNGAAQIDVKDGKGDYGLTKRFTTYLTHARPVQLEEYYRKLLPQHGWQVGNQKYGTQVPDNRTITQGLLFSYSDCEIEDCNGNGELTIIAKEEADGQTHVRIEAYGTDLP